MATQRAQGFASRAQDAATALEIAYRRAERLTQEWFATGMTADIPNDGTLDSAKARNLLTGAADHWHCDADAESYRLTTTQTAMPNSIRC